MGPGDVVERVEGGEQILTVEIVILGNEQDLGLAHPALHGARRLRIHPGRKHRRALHLGLGQQRRGGTGGDAAHQGAARQAAFVVGLGHASLHRDFLLFLEKKAPARTGAF